MSPDHSLSLRSSVRGVGWEWGNRPAADKRWWSRDGAPGSEPALIFGSWIFGAVPTGDTGDKGAGQTSRPSQPLLEGGGSSASGRPLRLPRAGPGRVAIWLSSGEPAQPPDTTGASVFLPGPPSRPTETAAAEACEKAGLLGTPSSGQLCFSALNLLRPGGWLPSATPRKLQP